MSRTSIRYYRTLLRSWKAEFTVEEVVEWIVRNFPGSANSNASAHQQCQRRRHPEKAHIKENGQQGRENISSHCPCQSASSGCSPRFVRKSMAGTFKTPSKHATKVRSTRFQSLGMPLI